MPSIFMTKIVVYCQQGSYTCSLTKFQDIFLKFPGQLHSSYRVHFTSTRFCSASAEHISLHYHCMDNCIKSTIKSICQQKKKKKTGMTNLCQTQPSIAPSEFQPALHETLEKSD